jgi:hypothetical protein
MVAVSGGCTMLWLAYVDEKTVSDAYRNDGLDVPESQAREETAFLVAAIVCTVFTVSPRDHHLFKAFPISLEWVLSCLGVLHCYNPRPET